MRPKLSLFKTINTKKLRSMEIHIYSGKAKSEGVNI